MGTNVVAPEKQMKKNPTLNIQNISYALLASESDLLLNPIDVIARRLQTNQALLSNFTGSIWKKIAKTIVDLNKGLLASAIDKAMSRVTRFVAQDALQESADANLAPQLTAHMTHEQAQAVCSGVAGFGAGVLETLFSHPVNSIKVQRQTNVPFNFKTLYNGLSVTMVRNCVAAATFFPIYQILMQDKQASAQQILFASIISSICTTVVSNPFDVLKTRAQHASEKESFKNIGKTFCAMVREEGLSVMGKGLSAKLPLQITKMVFPFFVYNMLKKKNEQKVEQEHDAELRPALK